MPKSITISPINSPLNGSLLAPASKSYAQRAIACAALARGVSTLKNYTPCDDSEAALNLIERLGARVQRDPFTLNITGTPSVDHFQKTLDCGEAGLGIRMFTPIAALSPDWITLEGHGSLVDRPLGSLQPPLEQLGVTFLSRDQRVPLRVKGPLCGDFAEVDGSLSSQVLTGLLLALTQVDRENLRGDKKRETHLRVNSLKSVGYIDMTVKILEEFGITVKNESYQDFWIPWGELNPTEYSIEGDWSGAAFWLVAGAIAGRIVVKNLDVTSSQSDQLVLKALRESGSQVTSQNNSVTVERGESLRPFEIDLTDAPDLFPPLAILAAYAEGLSSLKGVHRLTHKESNRQERLQELLTTVGIEVKIVEDTMVIRGGEVQGGEVSGYNDHRMVMCEAIMALRSKNPITIREPDCVAKSYPHFFEDLERIL